MSKSYEIRLRVKKLSQLLLLLDPSPFVERDFDAEAERFIVGWAQESPRGTPFTIIVELLADTGKATTANMLSQAIHNNCAYRVEQSNRELRELFRIGRRALLIGVPILSICLFASNAIGVDPNGSALTRLVSESLLILG